MNYRHGFHAGNFADCMKHAILLAALDRMQAKDGAIVVFDTHAGAGMTALDGPDASRTGEWREGIGRLDALDPIPPALDNYAALVRRLAGGRPRYPGSPALVAASLRPQDRLIATELHPAEADALARAFAADRRVAVHARDGYAALASLLPPPGGPRRALVLIDPPFERPGEFERIEAAIAAARARLPQAAILAWYPIKHRAPVRAFHDRLREGGQRDLAVLELLLAPPLDPQRLNGCGLLLASPPFGLLERHAAPILDALLATLGDGRDGEGVRIETLVDE